MPLRASRQQRSTGERSFQASFLGRQAQVRTESTHLGQLALGEQASPTTSLAEKASHKRSAFEGETSQSKTSPKHPSGRQAQLDLDKLEQTMLKMQRLQKVVRKLVAKLPPTLAAELAEVDCKQSSDTNNNNNTDSSNTAHNNNNTTNTNNTTNNNEPNNYNNNSKNGQEPSLNSIDLDQDNPESEPDLDSTSFSFLNPTLGAESRQDQQEDSFSLYTIGHKKMATEISLGSLIQQQQDEGMQNKKPKKRVSFDKTNLAQLRQNKRQQQAGSHPQSFKLNNLGARAEKQELPAQNNKTTTAQACWDSFQQHNLQQKAASASEKEPQHRACQNNSLGSEDQTLGNNKQACRCPSNSNNHSFGLRTKNTAAWSILIDTGAAISLAPPSFAQNIELSPIEGTLQLRSVNGSLIELYGRKTLQLCAPNLCVLVSFVIANVSQALIGMDILGSNHLSLIQSFYGFYLVNSAGALTQLHPRGHLLYLEAWPREFGFNNCRGSNLQSMQASLLNDKGRTQEEAVATSGGASHDSLPLENLREQQAKNTAPLGTTTALPEKGAKRRRKKKKKKPAAKEASQDTSQRSLEQQGQKPATTQLRSLEKPRIIDELEMVAEKEESNNNLGSIDLQQLSLRILLTLSLSKKWMITTTRAREACSQDALGEQLRNIGLGQHKMQPNIFCGDELVILLDQTCILIGGSEMQQECFFCELSALTSLEPPEKLAQDNQISFGNLILAYQEASDSISLSVSPCFVHELVRNHDLAQDELTQSLQQEQLQDQEASEHIALEAEDKELYKQKVGDLDWLAKSCRPDLSFEAHSLAQSLTSPTTSHQKQLRKVLSHLAQTKHCSLSLHPTTKMTREKLHSLELVAYSSTSWPEAGKATSTAYLSLWGAFLIASCKTSCAQQQETAELESMRLALGLACLTRSLLQQLDMDKLERVVPIKLRTSSWKEELVDGKPIAKQLGLSRRNKHQQLRGQLQISKVHPNKNLAHSLSHNASEQSMLAKLRINPKGDETGALSTVFGQRSAFLLSSSSFVGMVSLEHPKMEQPQLRQLALISSESCNESLSENLANTSLASLTLCSLSLERSTLESWSFPTPSLTLRSLIPAKDRLHSLTMQSLSLEECSLQSLTGQSLSLIDRNCFPNLSFRKVSLEDGNQELEENLAINLLQRRAETNSFFRMSLQEKKPHKEARTNSFFNQSFRGILSLCWPIFLLCSFQLVCSALFSKTSFPIQSLHQNQLEAAYSNTFQTYSLQPEELAPAYFSNSFHQESLQQDKLTASCFQSPTRARELGSLQPDELSRSILDDFDQLDLDMSLSFLAFNKNQLQGTSFCRTSFGQMELYSRHQLELPAFQLSLLQQQLRAESFTMHSFAFQDQGLQSEASNQISSALSAYRSAAYRQTIQL